MVLLAAGKMGGEGMSSAFEKAHAGPEGREPLAGGGASVTSATTGLPRERACAPAGAQECWPERTFSRPSGADSRCVGDPVVVLVTLAPPPANSFRPSGPREPQSFGTTKEQPNMSEMAPKATLWRNCFAASWVPGGL